MLSIFKEKLLEGVQEAIPHVSSFNSWRKLSWKSTLPVDTRQKIRRKHRLWTRYLKTVRIEHLNAYRKSRNEVPSLTRKKY